MTDKELRRLSRADLVEIIYEVRQNEAALQEEVESLKKQLDEKQKKISKAGSLAELSASLNGLFESAQATADQYLQEISDIYEYARKLKNDTERRASAVASQALKEREELLKQTEQECRRMKEEASGKAAAEEETKLYSLPQNDKSVNMEQEETTDGEVLKDSLPRKRTRSSGKSARPTTMNDRRKMQ